jgi:hypothetical protein
MTLSCWTMGAYADVVIINVTPTTHNNQIGQAQTQIQTHVESQTDTPTHTNAVDVVGLVHMVPRVDNREDGEDVRKVPH